MAELPWTRLCVPTVPMAPQGKGATRVSSREVRMLLRRADKLFAEGAKLQALARRALIQHFNKDLSDQPTAEDRVRRQAISRKRRKK